MKKLTFISTLRPIPATDRATGPEYRFHCMIRSSLKLGITVEATGDTLAEAHSEAVRMFFAMVALR